MMLATILSYTLSTGFTIFFFCVAIAFDHDFPQLQQSANLCLCFFLSKIIKMINFLFKHWSNVHQCSPLKAVIKIGSAYIQ